MKKYLKEVINSNEEVVNRYRYTPYGDSEVKEEQVYNPYQYTGRRYDEESGLYYYRARMYSPEQKRFVSQDPAGMMAGPNRYAYAGNNPINARDPSGMFPNIINMIDGGAGGGGISGTGGSTGYSTGEGATSDTDTTDGTVDENIIFKENEFRNEARRIGMDLEGEFEYDINWWNRDVDIELTDEGHEKLEIGIQTLDEKYISKTPSAEHSVWKEIACDIIFLIACSGLYFIPIAGPVVGIACHVYGFFLCFELFGMETAGG